MSTFYDEDIDIDMDIDDNNHDMIEEKIRQASSGMFKKLMEMAMIENFIDDELMKKRIWCLRKQKHTITHYDIDHYMNKAKPEEIEDRILELTMELAND